jgi:hypothetical protein
VDAAFHVWVNGEEVGYSQGRQVFPARSVCETNTDFSPS